MDTNIKAHNFIPAEYWKSNFKSVKEALLLAEVYVYEYDTEIQGFIGLNDLLYELDLILNEDDIEELEDLFNKLKERSYYENTNK